jgi:hypothetical protein
VVPKVLKEETAHKVSEELKDFPVRLVKLVLKVRMELKVPKDLLVNLDPEEFKDLMVELDQKVTKD